LQINELSNEELTVQYLVDNGVILGLLILISMMLAIKEEFILSDFILFLRRIYDL